jgi:hypothetical protein
MPFIRAAAVLAALTGAACHTMKVVSLDQVPASDQAWVTFHDKSVVMVAGPKLMGTKLVGFVNGKYDEFPAANVKQVVVRRPAHGRTLALVAAGVVATGGILYAVTGVGKSGDMMLQDLCDEDPDAPACIQ